MKTVASPIGHADDDASPHAKLADFRPTVAAREGRRDFSYKDAHHRHLVYVPNWPLSTPNYTVRSSLPMSVPELADPSHAKYPFPSPAWSVESWYPSISGLDPGNSAATG
ncbi:hypothetical protein CABS01_05317 [Colletotrichum abscissum]|uniref:Uncharacterized protein n=1 Tax=Colletotrichum abscissum TaxID=1671311 RepID=A0A9Q0B0E6_9PEZI|nr:uncharacterized protein CABS01_05317 [Colletotrichum abscissum]KAI3539827.1 hypothetical protein CABS02_11283 [Colletotrichum abscissum]KAK1523696.1 hypothetical protein CABS01_05317 [Colletotrichum abscissum]